MARLCIRWATLIVAVHTVFVTCCFAPAFAQDDLLDRPVLAVDPGEHTAAINSLAVDREGRFVVTGGADRTVRVWSVEEGKLLRTIWIPVGPDPVGNIYAVAVTPDGSTLAAAGWTEKLSDGTTIYLFDRESGAMIRRIHREDLPAIITSLTFSSDGRYLAATLGDVPGLRVFDRDKDWSEAFRDNYYGDSYGAAFAPDGRLATTSYDGTLRLYKPDESTFRPITNPVPALTGSRPRRIAFSPDGLMLAVGYNDVAAVDVFDGKSLDRVRALNPTNLDPRPGGLGEVAWSRDSHTLFAAGSASDLGQQDVLVAWDDKGLGKERRLSYCANNSAMGLGTLPDGRILVASLLPCLGLMSPEGDRIWIVPSPVADFRDQTDTLKVSEDGRIVDFVYRENAVKTRLRFDVRLLRLSGEPNDGLTLVPNRDGLRIDGWKNYNQPTLDGRAIPIHPLDIYRSLAIAEDRKRFFLGSVFGLAAFSDTGVENWWRPSRAEVWAVNASRDRRVVVAAYGDGTVRWRRADDGRELLALQVLTNKTDWVLWTPEGFYEATEGAKDVLKWVTNHGPDKAATTLPVSAIPRLHRPDALPLVLDELETARALGIADVAASRLAVQKATGSGKPAGGVLHVLAIGVDKFGDNAGGLHLDYAAEDAHDVASALLDSQQLAPGKPSLYGDVKAQYLPNDQASKTGILDSLDALEETIRKSGADQDVAVILVSSHGEMIDGEFYFIPSDFVANGSRNAATNSAISASEFAKKVGSIAKHGRVLLLLDACHSGAVSPGGWATDPDAKVLQDAMDLENVTVLTSSKKDELSQELPNWKHGAFTQAFLDALSGAADPDNRGVIRLSSLTDAMEAELQRLTKGMKPQHLGVHINFSGDLFVDNR